MKFYHVTLRETMDKIVEEGVLKSSWDGVVYLCKTPEDACKFLAVRLIREMSVIEVELDESEVEESFDHNEHFFKCKAYMHKGDIELTGDEIVTDYEVMSRKENL